ncbi:RNA helicase Mov10l1-like isoform X1 [Asterias amurensis]|uniref:RNA helicase Mov10l1-like isoform X1 n=1 Tax=Asterias amurensis TaxID=7602 RepID=UPI003AB57FEA
MLTAVFRTVKRLLLQDVTPSNQDSPTQPTSDDPNEKTVKRSVISLYDNLEYGQNFKDSDEEDVVAKETKSFRGKVTDLLYGYGLIDNDVYFTFDCVSGGERPDVDSRVDVVAERDHDKGGWKATNVRLIKSSYWDEDDEAGDGPQVNEIIGTVTKVVQDSGLINDLIVFDQDSLVYGFKPHRGDWVQGETVTDSELQTFARNIRPLREDKFRGTVTHAFPGYGHVNGRIYFSFKVCEGGWRPKKGDAVEGKAIESRQSKGNWRAIFMKQDTRNTRLRLETANNSPFRKIQEEDLKSNKGGIEITDDLGLGTTLIGNTKSTVATIRNIGKDSKTLTSCRVCCPTGEVTISFSAVSCSGSPRQSQSTSETESTLPLTLPPLSLITVTVAIKAKQLGRCLCQLTFHFGEFSIGRQCTMNAQDSQMMKLMPEESVLSRGSKFNSRRREKREVTIDNEFGGYFFPGVKPERNFNFNKPLKLPHYPVPRDLKACILHDGEVTKVAPQLMQSLSLENFSRRFSALLHLEEIQMEQDMREFDLEKVSMRPRKEFLSLEVPGLAEGRPSVLTGDNIIVTHPNCNRYEGFVYEVYGDAVLLKFHPSFHDLYQAEECSVVFTFSRTSLRRCHQACEFVKKLGNQVIFPTIVVAKPPQVSVTFRSQADKPHKVPVRIKPSSIVKLPGSKKPLSSNRPTSKPSIITSKPTMINGQRKTETQRFTNKKGSLNKSSEEDMKFITPRIQDMKVSHVAMDGKEMAEFYNPHLNVRQQSAVIRILQGEGRPMPYIIFGPPGTGKTVTVVEAILQVHCRRPSSRILACTPSNSAADLLTERIHDSNKVDSGAMVRLNAFHRSQESIPSAILPYCKDGEKLEVISHQRIIVCTCSTAGSLYQLGLTAGHFSHVFVDEAGQATEPECLVPVGLSVGPEGQIILAGDPMQLGPVLNSHIAKEYGLGQSFLERLILRKVYRRDADKFRDHGCYDPLLVTKLVENYRSHPSLLKLPSELFYHDELLPMADAKLTHQLTAWEKLPNKNGNCPLLFHGVLGDDMRDGNSPSWFNAVEVIQVIKYIQGLLASTSPVIGPDDIGVITPYRKQVEKIRMLLNSLTLYGIKVGSVKEFQGQERIAMIISTVRSSENLLGFDVRHHLGFLSNPKRFNVAITRAQALMVIIGNPNVLAKDKHWRALLNYCLELGAYTGTQPPALTQDSDADVESLDGDGEPSDSSPRQQDVEAGTVDERLPTATGCVLSNHNTENQCKRVPAITNGSDSNKTLETEKSVFNGRSEDHSKVVLVPLNKINNHHQEQSYSPQKLNSTGTDNLKTTTRVDEKPSLVANESAPLTASKKPALTANEKPAITANETQSLMTNKTSLSASGNSLYHPENYLASRTETTHLSHVPVSHHDQKQNSAGDSTGYQENASSITDGTTECLSKLALTNPSSPSRARPLVTTPTKAGSLVTTPNAEKLNHSAERIKSTSSSEQNLKSGDAVEEVCFAREDAITVESSLELKFGQRSPPKDQDSDSPDLSKGSNKKTRLAISSYDHSENLKRQLSFTPSSNTDDTLGSFLEDEHDLGQGHALKGHINGAGQIREQNGGVTATLQMSASSGMMEPDKAPVHEEAWHEYTQWSLLSGRFNESDANPAILASALRISQSFQENELVESCIQDDNCLKNSGGSAPSQQDAGQDEDEEVWDEEVNLAEVYQRGGGTPRAGLKEQWDNYSGDGGQIFDFSHAEQNPTSQEKRDDEGFIQGASHPHQEPGAQQISGTDFVEDDPEMPSLEEWFQDLKMDTLVLPTDTLVLPSDTSILLMDTSILSTDTSILLTDTSIMPSDTSVAPAEQRYPKDNRDGTVDHNAREYLANHSVPHEATEGIGGYMNMTQRPTHEASPAEQRYPKDNQEMAVDHDARVYLANHSVPHEATGDLGGYINMHQRLTPPGLGRGILSSKSKRRSSSRPRPSNRAHMIGAPTYSNPPRPSPSTCPHLTHEGIMHQHEANNEVMNNPHDGVYTDYDLGTADYTHRDLNLNPEEVKGQNETMLPQESSHGEEEWVGSENHFFYRKPLSQNAGKALSTNTHAWEETMRGYQTRYTTDEDFMGDYKPPATPVYQAFPRGGGYTGPDGSSYPVAANLETMDQYDVIIESSCEESSDNQGPIS